MICKTQDTDKYIHGCPEYMPPECLNGNKNINKKYDVWSIGILL